ncbi:MAG: alcohol dehydrogenase catalytic domain-containing protein [Actinobacteria bacterium]|nr:alcohol dehydrogenase catalytic domain-containing protein [Actinomycetota bacterium]
MKAVVMTEERKLEARDDYSSPAPEGWAVVDVKAAGVCGSELHFLDGMVPAPFADFVLGHEIAGVVAAAPAGSKVEAGDRVAVYNFVGCGQCRWCRTGHESICVEPRAQLGWTANGGFAEQVAAPPANLIKLPDSVSFEAAAVLACSGMTAVHAVRLAGAELGQTAIVDGVGGVGLMVIQVLAEAGLRVFAVADAESRVALAEEAGAAEVIVLPGGEGYDGLPDRVKALNDGAGADYFFELVGTEASMRGGIRSLGRRGAAVLVGYTEDELKIHPIDLILSEARVLSSVAASRHDLETAIALAGEGKLSVAIDTAYPLEEVDTAIARLRAREVNGRNVLVP